MDKLTMRWLGHACFALTSDDYHLVLDPYGDGTVPGLPDLQVAANEVLCSHGHRDHCGMDRVMMLLNLRHSPFTVTALPSWHDPEQGALRGENTIHLITCGDLRVAHLGDLGHIPDEDTCAALTGLDALMIPVGGHYTIGPEEARTLVQRLQPRVVLPMHYRGDDFGYEEIGRGEDFWRDADSLCFCAGDTLELTKDTPAGVVVLRPGSKLMAEEA